MGMLSGALRADRLWGLALLGSILALIGAAPFAIFMSEYQLLRAAVGAGAWVVLVLFLAAASVVFISALRHLIDMAFGDAKTGIAHAPSASGRRDRHLGAGRAAVSRAVAAALVVRGDRPRRRGDGRALMTLPDAGNAVPVPIAAVPVPGRRRLPPRRCLSRIAMAAAACCSWALAGDDGGTRLLAALADDANGEIGLATSVVTAPLPGAHPRLPRRALLRARNP